MISVISPSSHKIYGRPVAGAFTRIKKAALRMSRAKIGVCRIEENADNRWRIESIGAAIDVLERKQLLLPLLKQKIEVFLLYR